MCGFSSEKWAYRWEIQQRTPSFTRVKSLNSCSWGKYAHSAKADQINHKSTLQYLTVKHLEWYIFFFWKSKSLCKLKYVMLDRIWELYRVQTRSNLLYWFLCPVNTYQYWYPSPILFPSLDLPALFWMGDRKSWYKGKNFTFFLLEVSSVHWNDCCDAVREDVVKRLTWGFWSYILYFFQSKAYKQLKPIICIHVVFC